MTEKETAEALWTALGKLRQARAALEPSAPAAAEAPATEPAGQLRPDQCPSCGRSGLSKDNGLEGACPAVPGDDGKGGCPDPLAWHRAQRNNEKRVAPPEKKGIESWAANCVCGHNYHWRIQDGSSNAFGCNECNCAIRRDPPRPAPFATPGEVQEPRGTAACPICAWDKPHYHTQKEIADRPNIEGARAAFETEARAFMAHPRFKDDRVGYWWSFPAELARRTDDGNAHGWAQRAYPTGPYLHEFVQIMWGFWETAWRSARAPTEAPAGAGARLERGPLCSEKRCRNLSECACADHNEIRCNVRIEHDSDLLCGRPSWHEMRHEPSPTDRLSFQRVGGVDSRRQGEAMTCPDCDRLTARAEKEVSRLRAVLEGMADGDCEYGDGCPTFRSRHYRCTPCVAREALEPKL